MTRPYTITTYGRGRYTASNPSVIPNGAARDSLNLLHNVGFNTAKDRNAINRAWAARSSNARMLWAFEYVKSDLTKLILSKCGTELCAAADIAAGTTPAAIKTGLSSNFIPSGANANGYVFIADSATNYVSDGTSAGTNELQKTAPTGVITGASGGTATGNAAGAVLYCYTDVDAYSGAESPPSAYITVTRTADQGVSLTNVSLTFTTPWTTKKFYRTAAGGTQFYLVVSGITAANFAASLSADVTLDSALTTLSEVHDEDGVTVIEKPGAAKHLCWHRGRLFLANFSGSPTLLRWSRELEPTQFSNLEQAQFQVGKLEGDEITGLVSFRGSLVVFKTNSVWVMNGDLEETNFTLFCRVPGRGCVCPRTIVNDGDQRIFFLSANGVLWFDLASVPQVPVSDPIADDVRDLDFTNRSGLMVAGKDPHERLYKLAVTPVGASANTKVHVLNLDTGAWGRDEYGMGIIQVTCFTDTGNLGPIRNSNGQVKLYVGDESGYLYETDTSSGADGVTSGTKTGTVTGYSSGVITCSAAAFRTTGDKLKALPVTLYRAADNTYETRTIDTNAATTITPTVLSAWTGANPAVGDTIYIGAFERTLLLNRIDLDTSLRKFFKRMRVGLEKQTHTVPVKIGYQLDASTTPNETFLFDMSNDYFARIRMDRRCSGLSPYIDLIGVDSPVEILSIEFDAEVLGNPRPTR